MFSSISLLRKYDLFYLSFICHFTTKKILTLSHLISLIWINTTYLITFYLSKYSCNLFFYLMTYYLKAIAGLQLPAKKTFDMKVPGAHQNRACTFHTNPLSQPSPFFIFSIQLGSWIPRYSLECPIRT